MDISQAKALIASLPTLSHVEYFKAMASLKEFMAGVAKSKNSLLPNFDFGEYVKQVNAPTTLSDDDIVKLSQFDIDVAEDSSKGERKKTAKEWIRANLLGKTVKTVDGKVVHFNSEDTLDHVSFNAMRSRNGFIAKCVPFIPQIFAKGEYMGLGDLDDLHQARRKDQSIQNFHLYQKWVKVSLGQKKYDVLAQTQACERFNERKNELFFAGYNLKVLEKKKVFDSLLETGLHHADQTTKTLNNNMPQFDKMQDDVTTNNELPLLVLIVKDEAGKVIFDLENGIDELEKDSQEISKIYGDVIVRNEVNEILLVQRNADDDFMPNKWWIPGGKIEEDESNVVGASRELSEEVGINANPSKLVFLESKSLENGGTSHRFSLEVQGDIQVKLQSEELQNYNWVSIDDLAHYDLLGNANDLQSLVDKSLNTTTIQTPDSPIFDRQNIKPTNKDGKVTIATRQKANDEAVALLDKIESEGLSRDDLTAEQLQTLAKYTGNGGGITNHEGKTGSQYEYYTPQELASSMWDLAKELGFNGGRVLDPSAGTGVFTATSPDNAIIDSVELDRVSGGIAKVLNDGSRSHTVVAPFEQEANRIDDNSMDMVITNVPFGKNSDRGANKKLDKSYQDESLENYFILRSLEKLKHGGLAVFVTPTSIVSGKQQANIKLRQKASLKAEFLGAYRLPNSMFAETGADVVTDVIAFRKFSEEAEATVKDLYDGGQIDTLTQAGVLWDDFINGKYFLTEGKRFVLGETQEVKNKFGGLTEKVFTTKPNADIAKMLKKFGDSRINWDLLNTTEPNIIEYKNGDVVFQNGKQLTYQDGAWQQTQTEVTDTDHQMQDLLAKMNNAYTVAVNDVTWDDVLSVLQYCSDTGQRGLIPHSLEDLIAKARKSNNEAVAWQCLSVAKAIDDVFYKAGYGIDQREQEPELTKAMKTAFLDGKNSKLTGDAKQAHKLIALHYNKGEYSTAWRGDISNDIEDKEVNYQDKIAQMQYQNKSLYVSREQFDSVYPDIDPLKNDDWFVKANGDVIHANDFLVGKLSDRLADIDKEIAQATDDDIKAKLIKQKMLARDNIIKTDVRNIDYSLRSPLIDAETKVKFLQSLPDIKNAAKVVFDDNGRPIADIDFKNAKYDTEKLLNRMGDWLSKGTVTLGNIQISMTDKEALEWLSDRINTANTEFETWLKANDKIMDDLDAKLNSDENLYFSQNSDERPVEIDGMNPALKLHGYQNAFVRSQGRFFGGINGFGVGLGKTFTALASVQHVQNIGAKKKTIFVVPNSVLSNWRKEAKHAYTNMDDCIFIGLREKGDGFRVFSNLYDEDLTAAVDKKYRKIFMTYEAFKRIRLKDETYADYADYLRANDSGYEASENKKTDEKKQGNLADEMEKVIVNSNAPYLEDMNVDSIVCDEAHAFKNSITAPETESGIKYLSIPGASNRGDDAQAKMWYVRGLSANKDGVQLLTATPITNSPLEIYSMLCLTAGREQVNAMCGAVRGADDFLKVMCSIVEETVPTIDGRTRSQNVFTGIQNGNMLRSMINQITTVKDAKDVGMSVVIPNRDETSSKVTLSKDTMGELVKMQKAYRIARLFAKDKANDAEYEMSLDPTLEEAYNEMKAKFGETDELLGHPFNLIRKMDVMIADDEFSSLATFYDFDPAQKAIAEKVCEQFNKKAIHEEVSRLSEFTDTDNAIEIHKKDGDTTILAGYKVTVTAKIITNQGRERIVIDTMESTTQLVFEGYAEKNKLKLNVTVSAKVSAMLDNFKQELANPRGIKSDGSNSKIVKQIIFCDHLFLHNKIKRLLTEQCGIHADKIVVITGKINNEPDAIIDIQEGFNGFDDENRYQVIIANKKAEVGINLQRGTQAIHHLTTGWTPDSLEQRNGRGARQGNLTDTVHIYHYDADGTFDEFKRTMINKKDEWISSVLSSEGTNKIAVSGGMSQSEQDALIRTMGDAQAIADYQAKKDELEKQERLAKAQKQQLININIIKNQFDVIQHAKVNDGYIADVKAVVNIIRDNVVNNKNANDSKRALNTRENYAKKYAANRDNALKIIQKIIDSVSFEKTTYNPITRTSETGKPQIIKMTADNVYATIEDNAKDFKPSEMDSTYSTGWVSVFRSKIAPSGSGNVIISGDSDYQAEFDEKINTAKNLIKAAKQGVNTVGKEYGGMVLPDDADQKIIDGKAKITAGVYIEAGAITLKDGKYRMIDNDLRETEANLDNSRFYNYNFSDAKDKQIILPNDPNYLVGVKALAGYEDRLFAMGAIKKGEVGEFSKVIPMIAEYRDDSVVAEYDIQDKLFGVQHHKLVNAKFPFVVPVDILKANTALSKALVASYEKDGVNVDIENNKFSLSKESNVDIEMKGIHSYGSNGVQDIFAEFLKGNDIKLESNDTMLNDTSIYRRLTKQPENFLVTVRDAINNLPDDYLSDDITALSNKLYNDHIKADNDLLPNISDKMKDSLLYMACNMGTPDGNPDNFVFWNYLDNTAKKYKENKAQTADLQASDTVAITGNTKYWKDEIKDYANKYGVAVNRYKKKFVWDGANTRWLISYQAYTKLIQDYPKASNDLQIKKVS